MRLSTRLWLAVLCLVIGAAANFVVGWGIVYFVNRDHFRVMNEAVEWRVPVWPERPPEGWGEVQSWNGMESTGWRFVTANGAGTIMMVDEVGWPARSMRRTQCREGGVNLDRGVWQDGVKLAGLREPFPLRPIWPGFAINTGVYAALAGAAMLGAGRLRGEVARRRRSGGRCAGCGYELAGALVCPECGRGALEAGR